jgi:hypothetical protein
MFQMMSSPWSTTVSMKFHYCVQLGSDVPDDVQSLVHHKVHDIHYCVQLGSDVPDDIQSLVHHNVHDIHCCVRLGSDVPDDVKSLVHNNVQDVLHCFPKTDQSKKWNQLQSTYSITG